MECLLMPAGPTAHNKCEQPRCMPAWMAELAGSWQHTAKPHQQFFSPETLPVSLIY